MCHQSESVNWGNPHFFRCHNALSLLLVQYRAVSHCMCTIYLHDSEWLIWCFWSHVYCYVKSKVKAMHADTAPSSVFLCCSLLRARWCSYNPPPAGLSTFYRLSSLMQWGESELPLVVKYSMKRYQPISCISTMSLSLQHHAGIG